MSAEYPEADWVSERRLKREAFIKGFYKKKHLADGLLIVPNLGSVAIEVELTMKGKKRLEQILWNYTFNKEIHEAWYFLFKRCFC